MDEDEVALSGQLGGGGRWFQGWTGRLFGLSWSLGDVEDTLGLAFCDCDFFF